MCVNEYTEFYYKCKIIVFISIECNGWVPEVKILLIYSTGELIVNYILKRDLLWATRLLIDGTCFCWSPHHTFELIFIIIIFNIGMKKYIAK